MAWRIVKQPNGKFARFSENVDDFTDYDMTEQEAIAYCVEIEHMHLQEAVAKVQRALSNDVNRFVEAIDIVGKVHSKSTAYRRKGASR